MGFDAGNPEKKQEGWTRSAGASAKKGDGSEEATSREAATNLEKPLVNPGRETGKQASQLTEADVKKGDKTDAIWGQKRSGKWGLT